MKKRSNFLSLAFFFLLASFFVYLFFQIPLGSPVRGLSELSLHPLQKLVFVAYASIQGGKTQLQQLQEENNSLRVKLSSQTKEIQALHDQFATATPQSRNLLPATIIGFRAFVPGVSVPSELVIDRGSKDSIRPGNVVVSKDILIGRVSKVTEHASIIELTSNSAFSITAKTAETGALGIVTGRGDGSLLLGNVILSDTLKVNDIVMTKGSMKEDGTGSPPDLALGKITSIDKKPSALFQTARLAPLTDIKKLEVVFVIRTK